MSIIYCILDSFCMICSCVDDHFNILSQRILVIVVIRTAHNIFLCCLNRVAYISMIPNIVHIQAVLDNVRIILITVILTAIPHSSFLFFVICCWKVYIKRGKNAARKYP